MHRGFASQVPSPVYQKVKETCSGGRGLASDFRKEFKMLNSEKILIALSIGILAGLLFLEVISRLFHPVLWE